MKRTRREWSRAFTPRGKRIVNLGITGVPPVLRKKFIAKCKRLGRSQRNVLLSWIRNWVEGRLPHEDRPVDGASFVRPAYPDLPGGANHPQQFGTASKERL